MIPINKITKELGIKSFQLREWEKRGWLGADPILKDPENNGQRIYNEYQLERIHFIHHELVKQKEHGIVRTNIAEMDAKLLEEFGGEITAIEPKEMIIQSTNVEEMAKLILNLSREVATLKEQIANIDKKTDQVLLNQEEDRKRIAERDQNLLESLNQAFEAKQQIAADKEKKSKWYYVANWFK